EERRRQEARDEDRGLGEFGAKQSAPPAHAARTGVRPIYAVAPIALAIDAPASLSANEQRKPSTSGFQPNSPSRQAAAGWCSSRVGRCHRSAAAAAPRTRP